MTPTVLQLSRKGRKLRKKKSQVKRLLGKPQKRALVYKIAYAPPRKPNSARRRFAKVRVLGNFKGRKAFAYVPGRGDHGLYEFCVVLMEGGGPRDLPGINYTLMRGSIDFNYVEHYRVRRRSKFGIRRSDVIRHRDYTFPSWWGKEDHPKYPKSFYNVY